MKQVECYKCGHVWNYTGKSKFYVTCPHCYSKIKIKEKEETKL